MNKGKTRVIIVSSSSVMRNLLENSFAFDPGVEVVGLASGGLSATNLIRENLPDLLVIDSNLAGDEVEALVRRVKTEQPSIRCLVLTETSKRKRKMISLGADFTLRTSDYSARIGELLDEIH